MPLNSNEIPNGFSCPITFDWMTDPVIASDNMTYERSAIEQHFSMSRSQPTSPITRAPMALLLRPNLTLKQAIQQFRNGQPLKAFECPISKEIMEEPVMASDGYSYEKRNIESWFHVGKKSPVTNQPFLNQQLQSNQNLKQAISSKIHLEPPQQCSAPAISISGINTQQQESREEDNSFSNLASFLRKKELERRCLQIDLQSLLQEQPFLRMQLILGRDLLEDHDFFVTSENIINDLICAIEKEMKLIDQLQEKKEELQNIVSALGTDFNATSNNNSHRSTLFINQQLSRPRSPLPQRPVVNVQTPSLFQQTNPFEVLAAQNYLHAPQPITANHALFFQQPRNDDLLNLLVLSELMGNTRPRRGGHNDCSIS